MLASPGTPLHKRPKPNLHILLLINWYAAVCWMLAWNTGIQLLPCPALRCDCRTQGRCPGPCSHAAAAVLRCSRWLHLQVKQLCLGPPHNLASLGGSGVDEFVGRKEHPLARMLRDLCCKDTVRRSKHPKSLLDLWGPAGPFLAELCKQWCNKASIAGL